MSRNSASLITKKKQSYSPLTSDLKYVVYFLVINTWLNNWVWVYNVMKNTHLKKYLEQHRHILFYVLTPETSRFYFWWAASIYSLGLTTRSWPCRGGCALPSVWARHALVCWWRRGSRAAERARCQETQLQSLKQPQHNFEWRHKNDWMTNKNILPVLMVKITEVHNPGGATAPVAVSTSAHVDTHAFPQT